MNSNSTSIDFHANNKKYIIYMAWLEEKEEGSSSTNGDLKPLISNPKNKPKQLSSQPKTFATVFIAIIGAGVLGFPYTFKRTGLLTSLFMLFIVAALTHHCMMLLVHTRRKLESHHGSFTNVASFGDLGFSVCGSIGRFIVDAMIVLSQSGFCIGYLIFISNTLVNLFSSPTPTNFSPEIWGFMPKTLYVWGCFPLQLGLNSISTLTHLAPLSIFADVVDLGAMGMVMVEDVIVFLKQRPVVEAFGSFSMFFYGLGAAVYSFEGAAMVLPIESEMKDKEKLGKVLGFSMAFISLLYGGFGVLGYFAFGEETKDIITANLEKGMVNTLVQLGLCVNLFFTFPLMMNPVYEVVERRFWDGKYCLWLRWVLVFGVSLVALLVPNFADFSSLVGSGICCAMGFVLPALFHLMVFKEEMGWKGLSLDVAIMVLGVGLGVSGTWFALLEIFSDKV